MCRAVDPNDRPSFKEINNIDFEIYYWKFYFIFK
jgi:hypothetical protein